MKYWVKSVYKYIVYRHVVDIQINTNKPVYLFVSSRFGVKNIHGNSSCICFHSLQAYQVEKDK